MPATPAPTETVSLAGTYGAVGQCNDYQFDHGLVVLPVASRTAAHRVIRLHGGYGTRRVKWSADRRGAPPVIPAAVDTSGDTILHSTVSPSLPTPNREAMGFDWSVRGEYVFVQNAPRVAGYDAFPAGQHPYVTEPMVNGLRAAPSSVRAALLGALASPSPALTTSYCSAALAGIQPDLYGLYSWPVTIIPAEFASTHIIGA